MSYSSWISNGTNVAYEPKEKNTGEVITPFSTTAPGGVPNSSYAPSTYVLAASGAWIAQTAASAASEVRRPSVYTELTGNPSPYFVATNTNLVYDADANHITTYGAFELAGLQVQNDASFTYTVFQTKAQTWTSCTLNISRNYASTQWTSGTEARFYLSTDSGANWTLLLTDDYDSDPITVAIFSHTLATVNPSSLSAYQVKVEIDAFPSAAFNSVGVLYLQLYDIWIEGIYAVSGSSGTVTSITAGTGLSGGVITTSGTIAIDSTVATLTGTQTLTNKTLTSPTISSIVNTGTLTLPTSTDTLVGRATTDTLTNKSISGSTNTLSNIANASLTNSTISGVALGSNLNALTISSPLTGTSFNGSAAVSIGIPVATTSANGYLSSTDWTTFNNKGSGTVTSVTGTSPVVSSGGTTPAISIPVATTSVSGYLSSTDWTTFNNKGSGSVTSVAATVPSLLSISGSPITTSGTLAITYSGTALPVANGGTGLTTLTAGYIPYGAGTSAFGSSANLFWDSANSRLGIGTVSPSQKLNIYSSAGTPTKLYVQSDLNFAGMYSGTADSNRGGAIELVGHTDASNSDSFKIQHANDVAAQALVFYYASPTTAYSSLSYTERMRIDSSGNLLVGVTSASYSSANRGVAILGGSASGLLGFQIGGVAKGYVAHFDTSMQIWNEAASPILFGTSATERVRIDSSGNVSIGATTSSGLLTLKNNPSASAENVLIGLQQNGVSTGTIGKLSYQQSDDTMRLYNSSTYAGSALILGTNNSERVRIDVNGNVGIGTSTVVANFAGYKTLELNGTTGGLLSLDSNGTNNLQMYTNGSTVNIVTIGALPLTFGTNSTERVRIDSSGNVGIGTASPTVKLDANGDGRFFRAVGYNSSANTYVEIGGTDNGFVDNGAASSWRQYVSGDATGQSLRFDAFLRGTGFTERVRISSSGNVGIGTASPASRLHVYTAGTNKLTLDSPAANENRLDFAKVGTVKWSMYSPASSNDLRMYDHQTVGDVVTFASGGNVGIGTASPTVGLHVVKDQGSGYIAAFRSNVSSPYITFQTTSSITQIQGINSAFTATNDIAMQLSGGNVGIGTATPVSGLDVRKTSYALSSENGISLGFSSGSATVAKISFETDSSGVPDLSLKAPNDGNARIKFYTGATPAERMRIDPSGNVGIGTTPSYKLDVNGTTFTTGITISTGGGTNVANTVNIDTNGSGTARYYSHGSNSSTKGSHEFHLSSSNGSLDVIGMSLDTSGNLTNTGVFKGNSGTKGFGGITTTTSTSTPTGGSSGDHYYIY